MPAQSSEIRGSAALVTGGGSGIGRAICCGLGATGVAVAVIDRSAQAADSVVDDVRSAGGRASPVVADVAKAVEVRRAVAEARHAVGDPDFLINCAGIFPRSSVREMTEGEWDEVLATNLKSVFLMCREVIPVLAARGGGRILSIGSDLGVSGSARGAHYAASKGGLNAFTRSLARELVSEGIAVNCIAPGLTDTPMMRGANDPEYIAAAAARQPQGRLGQPEDIVGLVLFLLSEAATLISGQVINFR